MALEQDIANLVQAANDLTGVVDNKIQLINSELDAKKQEVDVFITNQALRTKHSFSEFLLLAKLTQGNCQLHGMMYLSNHTAPWFGLLSLRKAYDNETVSASAEANYGGAGFSVCKVTLDGVGYVALRNDGEANRSWIFVGNVQSHMEFMPVQSVDSVDEVIAI